MKLSLSIVAYNRPKLLERNLNALAGQRDHRWQVIIINDNSPDPEVERMAIAFLNHYGGGYYNTSVSDEERLEKCRPSVCLNIAMQHFEGDIFGHPADDQEFSDPNAVGTILDFFEEHPEVGAGYIGCGYRLADYKTGRIIRPDEVIGAMRDFYNGIVPPDMQGAVTFLKDTIVRRAYEDWVGYGGVLHKTFAVLDGCQVYYRRKHAFAFPEDKQYWMGEDAYVSQAICNDAGGFYPINDPINNVMIISNLNEASLTVQGSPEKSIAVHKQ